MTGAEAKPPEVSGPSTQTRSRMAPPLQRLAARPELTALIGLVIIFSAFALAAPSFTSAIGIGAWLRVAAHVGIIAGPVTLLLIAGEFDLSIGSVIGVTSILMGAFVVAGIPYWLSVLLTLAIAAGIGWLNGFLAVRLGISSLIVTLAGLFFYRGVTIGIYNGALDIGTEGLRSQNLHPIIDPQQPAWLFYGNVGGIETTYVWWILITVISVVILNRTIAGNWILASGGSRESAKALGVPVDKVRWSLFIATSMTAGLAGIIQTTQFGSVEALRGQLVELQAITAVVVGGTLLTGGYGSPLGSAIGAIILAISQIGLLFIGVEADIYLSVLGVLLIVVVVLNGVTRRRFVRA